MTKIEELITSLQLHGDRFPEEKEACEGIVSWIREHGESAFLRENLDGHLTAPMFIVNPERTRVLLMLHKKLERWQQFGGHCDGDMDVLAVAVREFHEESGIIIEPAILGYIFMVEIHDVPLDKKGTPPHKHFDIMYLGIIPEDAPFLRQELEVDDIKWFDIEGIENYVEDEIFQRIQKIRKLK